jgi:hypothetical protein
MDHVELPQRGIAVEFQVRTEGCFTVHERVDDGELIDLPFSRRGTGQQRLDQEPLVRIMPADINPGHAEPPGANVAVSAAVALL